MLNVFFTVDVEVWCDGWKDIDRKFPDAFRRYVYGPTKQGNYGLPYTLRLLKEHGLVGVFFVEPLFATRFGHEPLAEIVGLIREADQEIQLHLHTEWVDESTKPLLADTSRKRQFLRDFSLEEQKVLIAAGLQLIEEAGGERPNAFRAGSFGFNRDTLLALADCDVPFDSSYSAQAFGPTSGVSPGVPAVEPFREAGVYEYPLTVYNDGTRRLRPAQLTACTFSEMEGILWQALEAGRNSFVILSHNFEMLNSEQTRVDETVVARFRRLCTFLERNRDCFAVRGFKDLVGHAVDVQPDPLRSPIWKTAFRYLEQSTRRRYE